MEPVANAVFEYKITRTKIGDYQFTLNSPSEYPACVPALVAHVRPFFAGLDHERLVAGYFNEGGQLLGFQTLADGGRTEVEADPATVVRAALLTDARLVVLFHNHPNGGIDLSDNDIQMGAQNGTALRQFHILLVDQIVINDTGWQSWRIESPKLRHAAVVKGEYMPDPSDYDLHDPQERARLASELRISAGLQSDPNVAAAMRLAAEAAEGTLDPMQGLARLAQIRIRAEMGFDPNGEDGPDRRVN